MNNKNFSEKEKGYIITGAMLALVVIIIIFNQREFKEQQADNALYSYHDLQIVEPETDSYDPDLDGDIPVVYPEDGLFSFAWKEAARWNEIACDLLTYRQYHWYYSINNPENEGGVSEIGFTLDIPYDSVTQEQFNHRYLKHYEVDH